MTGHHVEASRLVAVEPSDAFDRLIGAPLSEVFSRRYAAFPPIREVVDQPPEWGTVGQVRTLVLADGGTLRETLTSVDAPHSYAYRLDEIHGPLRPFIRMVDGLWSITPEDTGSRIAWSWTFFTAAAPARLTPIVIGRMWQGYAARALAELDDILVRD